MKSAQYLAILTLLLMPWTAHGQTPTTASDYFDRGVARADKGNLDGAIADFTTAIQLEPRLASA